MSSVAGKWVEFLLAIVLGNGLYFSLYPNLPPATQHHPLRPDLSTPGVLYPFGNVATLVSYALLGQPFGAVDFLVVLYVTAGAMGTFLLPWLITFDPRAAFWGALK